MLPLILLALCALAPFSAAQGLATFIHMNWAAGFVQNMTYAISWSSLDMDPVSVNLQSGNYSQLIFADMTGGTYNWTVPIIIPGSYTMQLLDNSLPGDESPTFQIYAQTSTINTSSTPPMMSTTSTLQTATGTATIMLATTYTYWDTRCSCIKTAMAPAASSPAGGMNYTAPTMATPTMTTAPFMGRAASVVGSRGPGLIAIALLGVWLIA